MSSRFIQPSILHHMYASSKTGWPIDIQGRSQTLYTALSSAMELKLVVFEFLSTTHAKTNAKQMCPRSSHVVRRFTCVHLHAQTTVDAGNIMHLTNHGYFDYGKNSETPNLGTMPGWKWRRSWDLPCISVDWPNISDGYIAHVMQALSFQACKCVSILSHTWKWSWVVQCLAHLNLVKLYTIRYKMHTYRQHTWISWEVFFLRIVSCFCFRRHWAYHRTNLRKVS